MSTLFSNTTLLPPTRSGHSRTGGHQSNSWTVLSTPMYWMERRRQRKALSHLIDDKRLLDDIGLKRDQALREVAKAFWQ